MSASPPKPDDVDTGDSHPDNNSEPMDNREGDAGGRDLPYNELDVKEQDRWLPIANGG